MHPPSRCPSCPLNVGAGDARCSAAAIDTSTLLMKIENLKERNMAHTTIADMTVDDLRKLIRETVIQTLSEMLGDPDEGLELRDEFNLELQRALATDEAGKTISAQEVAARLGLTW